MALKDQHGLEILPWPAKAGPAKMLAHQVGTLFIESNDLRMDFAELKARGVEFAETEPEPYPYGLLVTALGPGRQSSCPAADAKMETQFGTQ
jgi:hypothetical protein